MADETERQAKLAQIEHLRQLGEKAYDDMYEAHSFRDANDRYREAKDCYYDAIGLANELGLKDEAAALSERLWHIKEVFRHQFVQ
jgi:hypothetical protein